ncbi:MAG: hypothetical protein QG608_919 [Actinomycetota bacterium]|nr:hypothetical protein [Actinomycetota bacterium]
MRKPLISLAVGALLAAGIGFASPVHAMTSAKKIPKYKNCTALNKVYKHGMGRKGARDKVKGSGKRVTSFTVNTQGYWTNSKLDRDKDGVACEKR